MAFESAWLVPFGGLIVGCVMGFIARRYNFCTLSSLERHWYANDSIGLRTWVLAIVTALLATQLMLLAGLITLESSFYLRTNLNLPGAIGGGVLFGIGMALTGTCGFGALVRLGSGSLRSLVVIVALGLAALTTQRGLLGQFRQAYIEPLSLDLSWAGSQSLSDIISSVVGFNVHVPVVTLIAASLLYWIFREVQFRRAKGHVLAGFVIGLCVAIGWFITYTMQQRAFEVVALEAGSFVLPPGTLIMHLLSINNDIPDYTVGLLLGVVAGAAISANYTRDVHWEACDDAREFGRHMVGAFFMGVGGVLAAGCTIGQGVSAASTLAISAPIVFFSIMLGARIGLSWLVEGSGIAFIRSH